jgi:hypothetical protein
MKYGLLTGFLTPYTNYGDYVQSMAVEYIYDLMGIPEHDRKHINLKELRTYDGEPLLLPYNYYFTLITDPNNGRILLSDKITPIFVGVTLADGTFGHSIDDILTSEAVVFFKKYAPVGCRDDYTRRALLSRGVPAYLQGCLSNILPKRKNGNYDKVFLINCPIEVYPYIPGDLQLRWVVLDNSGFIGDLSDEEAWVKIKQHYANIRDSAALVISSRYHAVTPCYAMGIPSIFIKRPYDHLFHDARLDTLNPYIPIYTYPQYDGIDWEPEYVDISRQKQTITELAINRIKGTVDISNNINELEEFWSGSINSYNSRINKASGIFKICLQQFVRDHFAPPQSGGYYIWGAKPVFCQNGRVNIVDYISEINPKLQLKGWIDTYKTGLLADIPIYKPDEFTLNDDEFLIIASESAIDDALMKVNQLNVDDGRVVICANRYITAKDLISEV